MLCDKRLCGRQAGAGGKLHPARYLSATVSILHDCDYVGRAGLFSASRGTDKCGDLCINLDAASRHKADYDLLRSYRALKVRYCPSVSVVSAYV